MVRARLLILYLLVGSIVGALWASRAQAADPVTCTLTVESRGGSHVEVVAYPEDLNGSSGGQTPFTLSYSAGTPVILVAQWQTKYYYFLRWEDQAEALITYTGVANVMMDSDKTYVACYDKVTDFYVNDHEADNGIEAGNDDNPGTSPEAPMRHIQGLLDRYPGLGKKQRVHVGAGLYRENVILTKENKYLSLMGVGYDCGDECLRVGAPRAVICGGGEGPCLTFVNVSKCLVTGFVLINGYDPWGGAVSSWSSSPTLERNVIAGSRATFGGGLFFYGGKPLVRDCLIVQNVASVGGGIMAVQSHPSLINDTITQNSADLVGGVFLLDSSSSKIENCILYGSEGLDLFGKASYVRYSCIGEGQLKGKARKQLRGTDGNIYENPLFVDPATWDFHLSSLSPCIDAADAHPASDEDLERNPRVDDPAVPNTGKGKPPYVDMGCDEHQLQP